MSCIKFPREALLSIGSSLLKNIRVDSHTWKQLKCYGINATTTRRGCRGGTSKLRAIKSSLDFRRYSGFPIPIRISERLSSSLIKKSHKISTMFNNHDEPKFPYVRHYIQPKGRNLANLKTIQCKQIEDSCSSEDTEFVPGLDEQSELLNSNPNDFVAEIENMVHLHNLTSNSFNIQNNIFGNENTNSGFVVVADRSSTLPGSIRDSLPDFPRATASGSITVSSQYVPKLMLANVMSLVPKLVEVREFVNRNNISLAFITETWLKGAVADSVIDIPGYSIVRRDRSANNHGGVCIYIKDGNIKYKVAQDLTCCQEHEILWLHLRPTRLPRGFSCLIAAVVYHPPGTNDESMCDHLFHSLATAESTFPNCGFIVTGDFNRLDVSRIKRHFRLKQVVKAPTRKDVTLDLVLTNMHKFYNTPTTVPPFGLSDHNTVLVSPKARVKVPNNKTVSFKRDRSARNKYAMGRYLTLLDWSLLFSSLESCEDLLNVFQTAIHIGLDRLMPLKRVRVNTNDAAWMTDRLKALILKRQQAFTKYGTDSSLFSSTGMQ